MANASKKAGKKAAVTKKPGSVEIFYNESPQYRIIYADGAWAALTPNLELQVAFFKNLTPAPEYVRQAVTSDGAFGKELEQVVKKGISREYEATIVMSRDVVRELLRLFQRTLEAADNFERAKRPRRSK